MEHKIIPCVNFTINKTTGLKSQDVFGFKHDGTQYIVTYIDSKHVILLKAEQNLVPLTVEEKGIFTKDLEQYDDSKGGHYIQVQVEENTVYIMTSNIEVT